MAKLEVSEPTFNELTILLKRQGVEINDGRVLTIEKGTAIMPPHDFRMVAIRQNCLIAAAEAWKSSDKKQTFLETAENIFQWTLNGINKPEPFIEGVSNKPGKGWGK